MKDYKHIVKVLKKISREDPSLAVKPIQVHKDKRTKRNRTKAEQNRKAIDESKDS